MQTRSIERLGLALLALSSVFVGAWAVLDPRGFYDSFPGAGRHWVSVDGPYNQHLVRDVGSLNLALAVLAAVAAWKLGPVLVRTAAVALLANAVPHFAYHATHLSVYGASDKVANLIALGAAVVIPCVVLGASLSPAGRRRPPR